MSIYVVAQNFVELFVTAGTGRRQLTYILVI
jgi:hypothetical protein